MAQPTYVPRTPSIPTPNLSISVETSASSVWLSWYVLANPLLVLISDPKNQGQNLILNMNDKGFNVVAYNRTTSKVDAFLANEAKGWWLTFDVI